MSQFAMHFSFFKNEMFLDRTSFIHPLTRTELKTVRGKTPGAFNGYGSFQWTHSVKAVSLLLLRIKALGQSVLIGEAHSLAASLDYSISKSPNWMLDMFGTDSRGTPFAKRMFKRTNPERKRGGSVAVSWNTKIVKPEDLKILINGVEETSSSALLAVADLMENGASAEQHTLAA